MSSYLRAVLVEQEWGWGEEQSDETNEGGCQVDIKLCMSIKFIIQGREWTSPTFVNICTVNNGTAAATADRQQPLAANAEAQCMLNVEY